MATTRGRNGLDAFFASAPEKLQRVLRGAGRAGGGVIAEEAKQRTASDAVREDIRVRTKADEDRISVTVDVMPGWGRSVGNWLEYGTAEHVISVDLEKSGGRTARRINTLAKEGHSLVIGGNFVGATVVHPGARPHPFLRPALDIRKRDAVATAQSYIDARVGPAGINAPGVEDDSA